MSLDPSTSRERRGLAARLAAEPGAGVADYGRDEAARRLGLPREAMRQLALRGQFGARRDARGIWRFDRESVDAAVAAARGPRAAPPARPAILLADADLARCARWRTRLIAAGVGAPVVAAYDPATLLVALERVRPQVAVIGRMTYFDSPRRLVQWLQSAPEFAPIHFLLADEAAAADDGCEPVLVEALQRLRSPAGALPAGSVPRGASRTDRPTGAAEGGTGNER